MRLNPTISFAQFKATRAAVLAAKAKMNNQPAWRRQVPSLLIGLVLGIGIPIPMTRVPAITAFVVVILGCIIQKPLQERSLKRYYAEEQARLNDQVLTVDESGISCDGRNGLSISHRKWQAFINLIDMPDAFVFMPSPNTFVRLPKETLTTSDCDLIREWSSVIPGTAGD